MRIASIVLLSLLLAAPAGAQIYNPNAPTGPAPIIPPVPPAAQPGMNPQPPPVANDSRSRPASAAPIRQGNPAPETHQDKSIRCSQQAAQLGLGGATGRYVGECVTR